jgi:hypothetical protein
MIGRQFVTLLAILGVIACASASQTTGATACGLRSADSVFISRGPVYRACAVERQVEAIAKPHPDFQPDRSAGQSCYSAELEFVVDTTGTPELGEARVVHANNPNFADAALRTLARWRYRPALLHGVPVRQLTTEKLSVASVIVTVPAGGTPRPPDRGPKC